MKTFKKLSVCVLALAILSACSKDEANKPTAPAPTGIIGQAAEAARADTARPNLPAIDANLPTSQYAEIDDGEDLMFLYLATTGLPPEYSKAAEAYSEEYRNTTDDFRKRDLLKALTPQIDQQLSAASSQLYRWMEVDDAELGNYDFERRGFPVGEFQDSKYRYFNNASSYKLTWDNHAQLAFAPVADEAIARELEGMRNDYSNKPRLKVYFMARSTDLNETAIKGHVTKVQVVDKSGRVLAEYGGTSS